MKNSLLPLMESKGVRLSPEEFHSVVNTTFHAFEARVYDDIHRGMWKSLYRQFELLSGDVLGSAPDLPSTLVAVDVGCGTGLSSEFLLRTTLGKRVSKLFLVDTSPQMLQKARVRADTWGISYEIIEGTFDDLPIRCSDIVLACSVLHHIPDLNRFFQSVQVHQDRGAFFLHVHDPNRDFQHDRDYLARTTELGLAQSTQARGSIHQLPVRLGRRIRRTVDQLTGRDYIAQVNRSLITRGVIKRPMADHEIWQVTDLHVLDGGISITALKEQLGSYQLVSLRSYGFFGRLWSDLPKGFQEREETLIRLGEKSGREIAGAWCKRA